MTSEEDDCIKSICKKFKAVTTEPELYLQEQPKKCDNILEVLREIYLVTVDNDAESSKDALVLPSLVTEDMDDEQIWQQLEVRNDLVLPKLLEQTSKLLAMREQKFEIRLNEDENDIDEEEEEEKAANNSNRKKEYKSDGEELTDDDELNDDDDDDDVKGIRETKKPKKKMRRSIVDDKFFKLDEMEEFLQAEDEKELRKQKGKPKDSDVDAIDYFAEDFGLGMDGDGNDSDDDDEEDDNVNYKDFFDEEQDQSTKPYVRKEKGKDYFAENESDPDNSHDKGNKFNNTSEEKEYDDEDDEEGDKYDSDENDNDESKTMEPASDSDSDEADKQTEKPKSSFELRQERLNDRIREFEQIVLGEKPWQLKGEVQGSNRPHNSLLEEVLEFDMTVRPPPLITEATTKCLEDIIKQRIKDQAWDDVVPKVRPIKTPQDYRKQLVLDQEKSKESLAQIYEKEYQREIDKLKPTNLDDTTEEVPKEHQEIRGRMRDIFIKLDALSNFHFTPKPVAPEPKIITNTPAIAMEEVAPVAVSDANLLAPEEVYRGPKYELAGKSERDRTDKNRERRKKKMKQRAINKALEEKDKHRQKMGIPLSKKEESAKLLKTVTKHRNVEKMSMSNDKSALKSSKAFFSKLQDSKTQPTTTKTTKAQKRKPDAKSLSAKKLKL